MRQRTLVLAVGMLMASSSSLDADEVVFTSGERLVGTVENLVDGKITVTSKVVGTVMVDFADVATFSTDRRVELHFEDGTVTIQKVIAADTGRIATEGTELIQPQSFDLDSLVSINPPPKPKARWEGNVTIGYTLTRGNSETETANVDIGLSRRAEKDRITLDAAYLYGRQENPDTGQEETTQDKWFGSVKYDYFFAKKAYSFGSGRVERNKIADLDNRLTLGGGLGYQWFESETFDLSTETGLAWVYEKFGDENDSNSDIAGQMGYRLDKKLNAQVAFIHALTYYPTFADLSDCYLTTQAELRASFTRAMFASFKVVMDYDSEPARDADKTDLAYIFGVGFTLF